MPCDNSKRVGQERQEHATTNKVRNCEKEGQCLEEKEIRKGSKPHPKMKGPEPGETFTFEVLLDKQFFVNPFLGEASGEHIFEKPPKKLGGARILDKTLSGEYVLGRPPKKPGVPMLLVVLMLYSLLTEVAGESLEDGEKKKWVFDTYFSQQLSCFS